MRQSLATHAIPSPKLFIKYPKTINEKREFSTSLVITETNVTAIFSKIGYLGIKIIMDKEKVNHSRVSIIQS